MKCLPFYVYTNIFWYENSVRKERSEAPSSSKHKKHVSLRHWYPSTKLCGVTSKKAALLDLTAMKIQNFVENWEVWMYITDQHDQNINSQWYLA
jgi:hypothetical protein